jgi:hypothetical protein
MTDPAADLLSEALETVTGPRRAAYGTPAENFGATAKLWNAYLNERMKRNEALERSDLSDPRPLLKRGRLALDAMDVAILMDLLKTARLIVSPGHRDSWLDKAGYAACGWSCAEADGHGGPQMMAINQPSEFRPLGAGDRVESGDELLGEESGEWRPVFPHSVGKVFMGTPVVPHRRRVIQG